MESGWSHPAIWRAACHSPGRAKNQSAYQSELTGLPGIVTFDSYIVEAFQIQDGAITIGCNNINVSYHGLQSTTFSSPKQDNFDLL